VYVLSLLPRVLLAVVFASTATLKLVADPAPEALLSPGLLRVVAVAELALALALGLGMLASAGGRWPSPCLEPLSCRAPRRAGTPSPSAGASAPTSPRWRPMSPFWAESVCWHWREP